MPKRTDIETILIIGAGPIIIGQACEFDYSGTQACKALRDEGYRIVLVNSNPATIMTDPDMADRTYVEPITPEVVAKIIEKERGDLSKGFALLPTMGGQTALNCALSLERMGVLEKFDVEMIGAKAAAIDKAEDRQLFRDAMTKIGLDTPHSRLANASDIKKADKDLFNRQREEISAKFSDAVERQKALEAHGRDWASKEPERKRRYISKGLQEALEAIDDIGLPAIIRPSFTLGGTGGGIAYNRADYLDIIERGLDASPTTEVLIEESVLGWKEYEMEVVRDKADNCIIVCSIENVDPMGVHTGDSITVAPALTLTDREYQIMRNASIAVLREIGVETGGSNVQFAINPENGRMIVIEMNPRVSRSSALASKATGFPIAKVAAKLAVGYTLDEIANDITGGATPASFEPTIDYVVTKIPRFAFEKFPGAEPILTTAMKSVGEAMAIGRTFAESLQKALRSMETGLSGVDEIDIEGLGQGDDMNVLRAALGTPTPDRLLVVAQALAHGHGRRGNLSCLQDRTLVHRASCRNRSAGKARAHPRSAGGCRQTFACSRPPDFPICVLRRSPGRAKKTCAPCGTGSMCARVFKRIDTCAAEFASPTAYMYSTYETPFAGAMMCEARPSDREKIVILGGGPNRIGQGIEFDYCCVHACFALSEAGYETIMVNCNPETVSTDYDTSDRLYFEPLTVEDVLEILRYGTANGDAQGRHRAVRRPDAAEARQRAGGSGHSDPGYVGRFHRSGRRSRSLQAPAGQAWIEAAQERHRLFGRTVAPRGHTNSACRSSCARPMCWAAAPWRSFATWRAFEDYLLGTLPSLIPADVKARYPNDKTGQINTVLGKNPLLFDRYLSDAIEVDVDCLCDGKDVFVAGIMEHIEEAGIHSGDSACSLPPRSLSAETLARLEEQTRKLALALEVGGLMNVQYALKDGDIYVLEVNPRASRTVPFVAKVIGYPIAKIASRIMAGEPLASFGLKRVELKHVGVKEAVFPFARFPGVDTVLGPEMRSTGEVIGLDRNFEIAFAKSQLGGGTQVPVSGTVFVSVRDADKPRLLETARLLANDGFKLVATGGTQRYLDEQGIASTRINKVSEGRPHVVDAIKNGNIQLVFNTTEGAQALSDSMSLRRAALLHKVPYYTTLAGAIAAAQGIHAYQAGDLEVRALQDYFTG